jgi:hypothetical protein
MRVWLPAIGREVLRVSAVNEAISIAPERVSAKNSSCSNLSNIIDPSIDHFQTIAESICGNMRTSSRAPSVSTSFSRKARLGALSHLL